MKQGKNVLENPYPCDPTRVDIPCQIFFNVDDGDAAFTSTNQRGFVQVPCRCSLYSLTDALAAGKPYSPGYCGSVIGGAEYANAAA